MKERTRESKEQLVDALMERARRSFIHYTKFTKPDYRVSRFNLILARKLDQFLKDVIAGKSPRLIIEAPPRHGKSELASRRFPAYSLGKYPDISFIAASWGSDLASKMNRDVQRIIDSHEHAALFPESRLRGSRGGEDGSYLRNSEEFEIVGHSGTYKSAGVGAGITGRGGHVLVVDDPIKDAAEAHSQTVRDSIWDWFTSTLYTRCEPGGGILVIMTRWHQDDLVGRLQEQMKNGGEKWDLVHFPARAEADEYDEDGTLIRKEGEPLHAGRYDADSLKRIELAVGERVWASLYQQRPAAAEGNIFKRENWEYLRPPRPLEDMSHSERRAYLYSIGVKTVIQGWDTALGGKKKNDYTACTTLGIGVLKYFVMDVWFQRLQFPDALKAVEHLYDKWLPSKVMVEGGGSASGKATVQVLDRSTKMPIFERPTVTDKEFRADAISPTHQAKKIVIIEGGSWVSNFVTQCAGFPAITHDDDVDSFMIAMEEALGGPQVLNITTEYLASLG